MIDEGVRRAYLDPDNTLRASILRDFAGKRTITKKNRDAAHKGIVDKLACSRRPA